MRLKWFRRNKVVLRPRPVSKYASWRLSVLSVADSAEYDWSWVDWIDSARSHPSFTSASTFSSSSTFSHSSLLLPSPSVSISPPTRHAKTTLDTEGRRVLRSIRRKGGRPRHEGPKRVRRLKKQFGVGDDDLEEGYELPSFAIPDMDPQVQNEFVVRRGSLAFSDGRGEQTTGSASVCQLRVRPLSSLAGRQFTNFTNPIAVVFAGY